MLAGQPMSAQLSLLSKWLRAKNGVFDAYPHEGSANIIARPSSLPPPATERHPDQLLVALVGYSSIQTTLIYLELVPDPMGSLAMVP